MLDFVKSSAFGARSSISVERRQEGGGKPWMVLRLRQREDVRRKKGAHADADRGIHASVPRNPRGKKAGEPRSNQRACRHDAAPGIPGAYSTGQWPGVRCEGVEELGGEAGDLGAEYQTGESVGKRLLRELQSEAAGRGRHVAAAFGARLGQITNPRRPVSPSACPTGTNIPGQFLASWRGWILRRSGTWKPSVLPGGTAVRASH